jgi:hypothetical protein
VRDRAVDIGASNRIDWWLFRVDAVAAACRGGKIPDAQGEQP